jgi:hypothetical protein
VRGRAFLERVALLCAALLIPAALVVLRPWVVGHDIGVYNEASAWVAGGPALYSGTPSEYPLAANLLFAVARLVADAVPGGANVQTYAVTWMIFAWWAWLLVLVILRRRAPRRGYWLWVTPTAVYFSVLHFDVYPVACTLAALLAAKDGRVRWAALWLGLAIALKGYAAFALPAFLAWCWRNHGARESGLAAILGITPMAASLVVVLLASGPAAMLYPFEWQAARGPNGQSTWDAVGLLAGGWTGDLARDQRWLPFTMSVACAIGAAALRPQTFAELCRAFVLAIGGYITFSVFYSPQFALWLVPPMALEGGAALFWSGLVLQWGTFAYAPVASHLKAGRALLWNGAIIANTLVRSTAILVAVIVWKGRVEAPRRGRGTGGP